MGQQLEKTGALSEKNPEFVNDDGDLFKSRGWTSKKWTSVKLGITIDLFEPAKWVGFLKWGDPKKTIGFSTKMV